MPAERGQWTTETVAGHRCEIYQPATCHPAPRVLIYLHGVHGGLLRDHPAFTESFAQHGLPVVAPIAGPTWWTDHICAEFDQHLSAEQYVRREVVAFIDQRWGARPPGIGLLGTSMGGQAVLRLAYKYPQTFPVVAALAPAIDYQIRYLEGDPVIRQMYSDPEAVRQDTAILYIHPLNWPKHQFFCCDPQDARWIDSAERLQMKLASLGIPHTCDLETEAGGHGFAYYDQMASRAVAFLADGLRHCGTNSTH